MSNDDQPTSTPAAAPAEENPPGRTEEATPSSLAERYSVLTDRFVHGVELAAASVFAILFAIGVIDLSLQIVLSVQSGEITDPNVVVGFIDTGLLLLIIVEVYQTVLAYVRENETRRIVKLIIYTGVIAMVRKAIIFRVSEYDSEMQAFLAALSYSVIIFGLVALLLAEQAYSGGGLMPGND